MESGAAQDGKKYGSMPQMIQRSSPVPLYSQIAQVIEKEIMDNMHSPKIPFYSDRQLLEKYNVSLLTARQAISELVRKKLVRRQQGRGTFITGRARRLIKARTKIRGDILFTGWTLRDLSQVESMFFHDIFMGIQEEAEKQGMRILFDNMGGPSKLGLKEEIESGKLFGAIALIGTRSEGNALSLSSLGLNTVTIGFTVPGLMAILSDSYTGGCLAVEHLLSQGCRNLVHLHSGETAPHWTNVKKAYLDSLEKAGLSEKENPVFENPLTDGGTIEAGYSLTKKIWHKRNMFDGIFAGNDMMAIGALKFFAEAHVDVPGKVKVIGFDDIEAGKFTVPPLSTVSIDRADLGRKAVQLLCKPHHSDGKNPFVVKVDVKIEPRASTSGAADASHVKGK